MSSIILSIESSCDETACSLFDLDKFKMGAAANLCMIGDCLSSQVKLHREYGGVVPELASREHMKSLPLLVSELISKSGVMAKHIRAIGVTAGPGLKGCLLVGVSFSKGYGVSLKVPVFPINHLEGHLLSGFYNCSINDYRDKLPALALLVSGGHTQLVLIEEIGKYMILAATQDDAAGEAFDKIGSLLGLGYPAGKLVSDRAKLGKANYTLPKSVENDPNIFSFSGLKTAANILIKKQIPASNTTGERDAFINNFCASLEDRITETLVSKTRTWIHKINNSGVKLNSLIICGGVAGNLTLRKELTNLANDNNLQIMIPPMNLCTDNAVMIALACAFRLKDKENFKSKGFSVRARWPVTEIEDW